MGEAMAKHDLSTGTPAKIIEAAEQLFWFQGYKATSIDEIVKMAGQSKGAFFHYFASKSDVTLYALDKYAQEEIIGPLHKSFEGSSTIKDGLLAWAMALYTANGQKQHKGGCLLGNMALELADRDENVRAKLSSIFLEWENALVTLFRDESRSGTILMEPRQFARLVIGNLQGVLMNIKVHKDKNRAGRDFQALAELFERLIKD